MNPKEFAMLLVLGFICAGIGGAAGYFFGYDVGWEKAMFASISSFEECAASSGVVMESHPRQCRTEDGRHFVERLRDAGNAAGTRPAGGNLPEGWTDTP